jgi:hypothetical protein
LDTPLVHRHYHYQHHHHHHHHRHHGHRLGSELDLDGMEGPHGRLFTARFVLR